MNKKVVAGIVAGIAIAGVVGLLLLKKEKLSTNETKEEN